jgi:hypothetical protein
MPKKDDAPEYAVCDGCGMERDDVDRVGDLMLCEACENHRADDPVVTIHGRMLHYSELKAQAEDDEHLAAALDGDSVQDQVRAARAHE